MMLKSFGINPDEIIKEVTGTLNQYGAVVVDLKQQMNRVEAQQIAIMRHLKIPPVMQEDKPAAIAAIEIGDRKHGT
jgi:hypothetical protein